MEETAWPHAPVHRLSESGTYIVTAGTYQKRHFFRSQTRLRYLHDSLLHFADEYGWQLEAWAVFSNHYHFVGHSPPDADSAENLSVFLSELHVKTTEHANDGDSIPGRKVWHNFWETLLTYEKSYLSRLNYVHQNPVRHGLVQVASHYPWSSAAWFEKSANPAQIKTVYSFKTDRVKVLDEFDVEWDHE